MLAYVIRRLLYGVGVVLGVLLFLFVLFLVFAPISWYWIQSGMNDAASS